MPNPKGHGGGSSGGTGIINVTIVDGTTWTGRTAPDGSVYVVETDGSTFVGLNNPCGAMNIYITPENVRSFYAPNGAMYCTVSPYVKGAQKIIPITDAGGGYPGGGAGSPNIADQTIVFGRLTKAAAGKTSLVNTGGAITGATTNTLTGTNSDHWDIDSAGGIVPTAAFVASPQASYTLTATVYNAAGSDTCTLTITTTASAYSVANNTELAAAMSQTGANLAGKTVLMRPGDYNYTTVFNNKAITSEFVVKSHDLSNRARIITASSSITDGRLAAPNNITFRSLRFYAKWEETYHRALGAQNGPPIYLNGSCSGVKFDDCEFDSNFKDLSIAEGILGTDYGWRGLVGSINLTLTGTVTFSSCVFHGSTRLLNIVNSDASDTQTGKVIIDSNDFYDWRTDCIVIAGIGAHEVTNNTYHDPFQLSTDTSHSDFCQILANAVNVGTVNARSYAAKGVIISNNVMCCYRNDSVFSNAGKTYNTTTQGPFCEDLTAQVFADGFSSSAAWTLGTGWSIGSGVASYSSGAVNSKLTYTATKDLLANSVYTILLRLVTKPTASGTITLRARRTGETYEQAYTISSTSTGTDMKLLFNTTGTATGFTFEVEMSSATASITVDSFTLTNVYKQYEDFTITNNLIYGGSNYGLYLANALNATIKNNTFVVDPGDTQSSTEELGIELASQWGGPGSGNTVSENINWDVITSVTAGTETNNIKVDKDGAIGGRSAYSTVFTGPTFTGLRTIADVKAAFTRKVGGPADTASPKVGWAAP